MNVEKGKALTTQLRKNNHILYMNRYETNAMHSLIAKVRGT